VLERTLEISGNECDFLVLRTGEVLRHAFVDVGDLRDTTPPSAFLQWVKDNGVDLGFCFSSNKLYAPLGLATFDMGIFAWPSNTIPEGMIPDFASRAELEAYSAQHGWPNKKTPLVGSLVGVTNIWRDLTAAQLHGPPDGVPAFFIKNRIFTSYTDLVKSTGPIAFSTRGGLEGLMLITGLTNNPPKVTIRYKLVQKGNATKAGSAGGNQAIGGNVDVIRIELSQAEAEVVRLTREVEAGLATGADLEAARDKVEVLKTELTGDAVKVARRAGERRHPSP
jgi:hypothetical protein